MLGKTVARNTFPATAVGPATAVVPATAVNPRLRSSIGFGFNH
jgi:hypothetical protein